MTIDWKCLELASIVVFRLENLAMFLVEFLNEDTRRRCSRKRRVCNYLDSMHDF
jgi:hypothetical protein